MFKSWQKPCTIYPFPKPLSCLPPPNMTTQPRFNELSLKNCTNTFISSTLKTPSIVFLCVLRPNAEGVSGVNEEKQDLPIKLLLASKSSQTQRVLTFNPLDLREMNRMPSEWVNVPHSLRVWNNNKRIMRRLVLQGAKMCFRCGNMQPRLSLLPMN